MNVTPSLRVSSSSPSQYSKTSRNVNHPSRTFLLGPSPPALRTIRTLPSCTNSSACATISSHNLGLCSRISSPICHSPLLWQPYVSIGLSPPHFIFASFSHVPEGG